MSKRRKVAFWIMGAVGILVILLLAAILLAPRLIQSEAVKGSILAEIGRRGGGQVGFGRADLALFPLPHVAIHGVSLSFPGAAGTIDTVTAYPELLPLLKRKLRIAKLSLEAPNFTLSLPDKAVEKEFGEKLSLSNLERRLPRLLSLLESNAPSLEVALENGSLTLSRRDAPALSFRGIRACIISSPERLKIQISCGSNLWEHISLEGSVLPRGLKGRGQIDLVGFRPHFLKGYLPFGMALPVTESVVNLQTRFQAEGLRKWEAQVQGSIPSLTLHRGQRQRIIRVASVKGSFRLDEGKVTATITDLALTDPLLRLAGGFTVDPMSPTIAFEVSSEEVDIGPVRETALALAGDVPPVKKLFRIIKAGRIPRITIRVQGKSIADLGTLESIQVAGSLRGGDIFLPGVALDLKEVSGDVLLSRGILSGEHIEARLGKAKGQAGTLRLALAGNRVPFYLNCSLQVDLGEAPPLLRRLVKNEAFRKELSLVNNLKGYATGRLVLNERGSEMEVRVDISKMNLAAHYQRVPYPIVIHQGQVSYEGDKIRATGLSGTLGSSSFSGVMGRLNLGKGSSLAMRCGKATLLLDDLYPWLHSLEGFRKKLQEVQAMKGTLEVSALSLECPLAGPGDWRLDGTGAVKDVVAKTSLLPGPVRLASGKIRILPDQFSFAEIQAKLLDAALHATGDLHIFGESLSKVHLVLDGKVGPEATRWLCGLIHLPSQIRVPSSFSVSRGEIAWGKGTATAFKGNMAYQDGPKISVDVAVLPKELAIKNLEIQDETSQAALGLVVKKKAVDGRFSGNLTRETAAKIVSSHLFPVGWVKGDLEIHLRRDQIGVSTAQGKIEGENLELPLGPALPLVVERFSLDAARNEIRVKSANLIWEGTNISLNGDVHFFPRGMDVDLDVSTGGIDLERLVKLLRQDEETPAQGSGDKGKGKETGKEGKWIWDVPVAGLLRLDADHLTYGKFTWSPVRAVISFDRNSARVMVSEASLCGISTSGDLEATPPEVAFHFHSVSREEHFDEVLSCLVGMKTYLTGKFDLDANITGQGTIAQLARGLNGNLRLSAKDGRIYRWNLLARIFAVLNVTEIFRGRLPGLGRGGLVYQSLGITGQIKEGKFVVTEALLDSTSIDLVGEGDIDLSTKKVDLVFLVAPFGTVDLILSKIPVVGRVLGKKLITVPMRVTGDLDNPNVSFSPISAVKSQSLTILKNMEAFPLKLIQPLIPGGGGK